MRRLTACSSCSRSQKNLCDSNFGCLAKKFFEWLRNPLNRLAGDCRPIFEEAWRGTCHGSDKTPTMIYELVAESNGWRTAYERGNAAGYYPIDNIKSYRQVSGLQVQ